MLFDLYTPRVIPYCGIDKSNPNKDYSNVSEILGSHSEIPRSEYNYVYNKDGVRSIEFSTHPEIITMGCSITLGQGLPVTDRWSSYLGSLLGTDSIGNISYSGAAINKNVSSFFGLLNQYKYKPKYVLCNFAGFERFYLIDGYGNYMRDWYSNYSPKAVKATVPWNYEAILPFEWVYYNNLDHIKMLETVCDMLDIKLIWTTWSNSLKKEQEQFIQSNFNHYIPNPVKLEFPPDFEFDVAVSDPKDLIPHYKMRDWDSIQCHMDLYNNNKDIFHHGYDYHKIAGDWGPGAYWPHHGAHYQMHTAEFFYKALQ